MKITRDLKIDGNLDTELFNTLSALDEKYLYYKDHSNLKHPIAIYNVSSSEALTSLENFINVYKSKKNESNYFDQLDSFHKNMLDSINNFIEINYKIFLCLFKPSECNLNKKFYYQKLNDSNVIKFTESIREMRLRFSKINNKVKHDSNRYHHITLKSNLGESIGYFIEEINENQAIRPDREIHKDFNGCATGISYLKDLYDYIFTFFTVGKFASDTIFKIIKS